MTWGKNILLGALFFNLRLFSQEETAFGTELKGWVPSFLRRSSDVKEASSQTNQPALFAINGKQTVPTPSASPLIQGMRAIAFVDFLYWTVREDGLEYDLLAGALLPSFVMQTIHVKEPEFTWSPAFRLGVGIRTGHDFWELKALWTCLFSSASKTTTVDTGMGLLNNGVWNDSAGIVQSLNTTLTSVYWSLHYNLLSGGFSRSFFLGKNLSSEVAFGPMGIWIDQKMSVQAPFSASRSSSYPGLSNGADLKMHFTNQYQAGGLFFRASPQWNVLPRLSVLGSACCYLAYGSFDLSQKWFVSEIEQNDLRLQSDFAKTRIGIQGALGLKWAAFMNETCHIGIELMYEGMVWFKQNLWSQVNSIFAQNYERQGDLEMQGVSASIRLDF